MLTGAGDRLAFTSLRAVLGGSCAGGSLASLDEVARGLFKTFLTFFFFEAGLLPSNSGLTSKACIYCLFISTLVGV